MAEDVGQHGCIVFSQYGQFLRDEGADAYILEADCVEHARGGLAETRRGRSFHGFAGKPLHDEAAKTVQVNEVGKLDAITEGAAGGKNGISQAQGANLYAEIDSVCGTHFGKSLPRSGRVVLKGLLG
jgi:hypothetical protein